MTVSVDTYAKVDAAMDKDEGLTIATVDVANSPIRMVVVPRAILELHRSCPVETESRLWQLVRSGDPEKSATARVYLVALIENPLIAAIIAGGRIGPSTEEGQSQYSHTRDPIVP